MIHSFLMIGQSNMAGRGNIADVEPIINDHLLVLRNGRWQPFFTPVNPDRPFSGITLAESFADAYQKAHQTDVGLIPCADGGTRLAQWKKGGLLFDHAVFQARLAQRTSTIAGVLWHQGESDCTAEEAGIYGAELHQFYRDLMAELQLEDVPFLVGGLGDFLIEREPENRYFATVNRQLMEFAEQIPMAGFVSAVGLEGKTDHLHFTAKAQRSFGNRYFQVFRSLENKEKVFVEKKREDLLLKTEIDSL